MIVLVQQNQVYYCTAEKKFQPELPTLVFIHDAQNDHSVWSWKSHHLADPGYNVLAVDLKSCRKNFPGSGSIQTRESF